jgi:hypothetical protein
VALDQIQRKLHIIVLDLNQFVFPRKYCIFSSSHVSPARLAEKDDRYHAGTVGGAGDIRAMTCDRNFIAFQTDVTACDKRQSELRNEKFALYQR